MMRPPGMMPRPTPFMLGPGMGGMKMPFMAGPRMPTGSTYGGMPSYGQGSGYSPNAMMNPYSPAGNGGNGYGGGGNGSAYGTGASAYSLAMTPVTAPSWLDALGLPSEGGKLAWPLGLRVLAPASEMDLMRQRVDALLPTLAAQAGQGTQNTAIANELATAVRQMRRLLAENGDGLADATRTDASRFLTRLGRALKLLQS
jgi:hypothetical protein